MMDDPRLKVCEECGKDFTVTSSDLWAYKLPTKAGPSYFCRYNCVRSAEKRRDEQIKFNRSKERKIEVKANKPKKGVLEKDLMLGLPIAQIAKKYEALSQTIHNWIKSYGLAGIQGQKKPVDKPIPTPKVNEEPIPEEMVHEMPTPRERDMAKNTKFYDDYLQAGQDEEMVQASPTLAQVEQFHTDDPAQEIPKTEKKDISDALSDEEYDQIMSKVEVQPINTDPTLGEIWETIEANLAIAKMKYAEQADKDFSAQLLRLGLAVTNDEGIAV